MNAMMDMPYWIKQTIFSLREPIKSSFPQVKKMKTKDYKDSRKVKMCRDCGAVETDEEPLTVHHVIPQSQGGADTEENYRLLCRDCHDDAHRGGTESGLKRII